MPSPMTTTFPPFSTSLKYAKGIVIRAVIEAKRSATGYHPRAVIRNLQTLISYHAGFGVAARLRIDTLATELDAERTDEIVHIGLLQRRPHVLIHHQKQ